MRTKRHTVVSSTLPTSTVRFLLTLGNDHFHNSVLQQKGTWKLEVKALGSIQKNALTYSWVIIHITVELKTIWGFLSCLHREAECGGACERVYVARFEILKADTVSHPMRIETSTVREVPT